MFLLKRVRLCFSSRVAGCFIAVAAFGAAVESDSDASELPFIAGIEVIPAQPDVPVTSARGIVFEDLNRDGRHQADEPGVDGVMVSNGRDVTQTNTLGRYTLPVFDNMTVMISKPARYALPVDQDHVPQFSYVHKPEGTPQALRYGGLPPTGPLPEAINFPLVKSDEDEAFSCVAMGDTQTYSNNEVGYIRDSIADNLLNQDLSDSRCMLLLGDVMGDDLGLLPRFKDMMSVVGLPQYYVHGNHDFDFDAESDADSADSWRRLYGPNYYSFEIGKVLFIALDNVIYPCTARDATGHRNAADRARCGGERPAYNGRVSDQQMEWLSNILAMVPTDRLVVLMHHIPMVSFIDSHTGRHQTDNVRAIHDLLRGRPALSLSGHTHTYEYLAEGEWFEKWEEMVGVTRLPFDHVVGGAPSGNWFSGDFGFDGTPLAFARGGTPPGYMVIHFEGNSFHVDYHASNQPADRAMALSFNTPQFREWFDTLFAWQSARSGETDPVPPVSVNDLPDLKLFTPDDLSDGVFLTANVWNGDRNTTVFAEINGGPRKEMTRTQEGEGEDVRSGAAYADPFSIPRQMTIGRFAWESQSGEERAQGFELWQGRKYGPAPPQAVGVWMIADSSPHLWRLELPRDLPVGTHVARIISVDRRGRENVDHIVFEVRADRPPRFWRKELWPEE